MFAFGKMETPLISVVIPVYNSARFLPRCIDSVLRQSYRQIEVLLVDDESTDGSEVICDNYASIDSRIRVFHKKNSGTGPTRQFGYEHSIGDYVAFVDNDDFIQPTMYEVMLKALLDNNADVCACLFNYLHIDGTLSWDKDDINPTIYGVHNSIEFAHFLYEGGISNGIVCSIWNKLFKRDLLKGVQMRNGRGEEEEVNDFVNKLNCKIYVIKDELYYWCENDQSVTHKSFNEKNWHFLRVLEQRARWFSMDDYLRNESLKLYCTLFVEYFYYAKKENVIIPKDVKSYFYTSYRSLLLSRYCNGAFYLRILFFMLFPAVYGRMTGLIQKC